MYEFPDLHTTPLFLYSHSSDTDLIVSPHFFLAKCRTEIFLMLLQWCQQSFILGSLQLWCFLLSVKLVWLVSIAVCSMRASLLCRRNEIRKFLIFFGIEDRKIIITLLLKYQQQRCFLCLWPQSFVFAVQFPSPQTLQWMPSCSLSGWTEIQHC